MRKNVLISVAIMLVVTAGCNLGESKEVVLQQFSPNGLYKATLVKYSYDATVEDVYRLYVHEYKDDVFSGSKDLDVLRVNSSEGLEVRWVSDKSVAVKCVVGDVFKYNSIAQLNEARVRVELETKC